MTPAPVPPHRQTLRALAQRAGYPSRAALARGAGVADWQLARLEWGLWPQITVGVMVKVAIALQMPLDQLLMRLGAPASLPPAGFDQTPDRLKILEGEYQRLQQQLSQQSQTLQAQFQQQVLDILEPWLLQWPTAAAHAQANPTFSAQKLLPLTRPIAALLTLWQVAAIATVGETVPYDPHCHELMGAGPPPSPGTMVQVRYVGYRRGDRLLHRAKVSLAPDAP